jgi:hypothetical protein
MLAQSDSIKRRAGLCISFVLWTLLVEEIDTIRASLAFEFKLTIPTLLFNLKIFDLLIYPNLNADNSQLAEIWFAGG